MKRSLVPLSLLVVCVAVGLLAVDALSWHLEGEGVQIAISPQSFVLKSPDTWVTVHTNLSLGAVDRDTVELSGVPASLTKADSRGNLVAKFHPAAIAAIVEPPEATLTLTGLMENGTPFSGSDTIAVR